MSTDLPTGSPDALLDGIRVVDASGEPASMAGRILADLGAEVVKVGDADDEILRRTCWDIRSRREAHASPELLEAADVVIETPGWPGAPVLDPDDAPDAVWIRVTPFGSSGPRAGWRATDLGVMAASGNMHATGDSDRPPVRCTEPTAYAHVGPEVAFAALTGLASGEPQLVDLSMQEVVLSANMCAPARFAARGQEFKRRGASVGRTREIWPCRDGWVSFGLRGGKARVPSLETVTRLCEKEGVATAALSERDWSTYSHTEVSDAELRAIEAPVAEYFARHTMAELYEIACDTNLMLAPINSPREIYASAQLVARELFATLPGPTGPVDEPLPRTFVHVRPGPAPDTRPGVADDTVLDAGKSNISTGRRREREQDGAWAGTKIVEFGSGAAGPVATRYFVEHGATVVRVESRSRPDFLRVYALGPGNPHGLEGSEMFDGLNVGKLSITLDLKHPDGVEVARRLVHWADAVSENFAPRAMRGFGLDYQTLVAGKPDLVMVSSCLNGQTGPHKDYPGFGGQGAALSGYNFLTGWPDREPVGPFGTITDSLAPRFAATALAAGLRYRETTGRGVYLDVSQVEAAIYSLSPWLLRFQRYGDVTERMGNRSLRAVPHGAFPCRGRDEWVAIACWTDTEWAELSAIVGYDDPSTADFISRAAQVDEIEKAVARWTADRSASEIADTLQAAGIEAVPVESFADLLHDPQLAHRGHFVWMDHPVTGRQPYERNGFRLSGDGGESSYRAPGPLLGEHTDHILRELLRLPVDEVQRLESSGALE